MVRFLGALTLRRAIEVCLPDIEARKIHFGVDLPDGAYLVEADAARLQQVFWNLLKNGIKFTPVGGCVGIRGRRDGADQIVVEVNDSGVGIEPEALPLIFHAFEQGERSRTRQFGGLGLGLTISKAMVELHGGSIAASNPGKDQGATFLVRLPLLTAAARPSDRHDRRSEAVAKPPARRLRILLVEEHGDTAWVMTRLLKASGHQVEAAADVATALNRAEEGEFDLLLSDLGLPDGSGLDLMRALRARGSQLPGIALSGYGQEQDIQQSRDAGFTVHVTKPVDIDRLMEAIRQVTESPPG